MAYGSRYQCHAGRFGRLPASREWLMSKPRPPRKRPVNCTDERRFVAACGLTELTQALRGCFRGYAGCGFDRSAGSAAG
jgi:hypothetical protein